MRRNSPHSTQSSNQRIRMQITSKVPCKEESHSPMAYNTFIKPEPGMSGPDESLQRSFEYVSLASRHNVGHRTLFEDPARVQQWAATSATGSMPPSNTIFHTARHNEGVCSDASLCYDSGFPDCSGPILTTHDEYLHGPCRVASHTAFEDTNGQALSPSLESCSQFAMDPSFSDSGVAGVDPHPFDANLHLESATSDWPGQLHDDNSTGRCSFVLGADENQAPQSWLKPAFPKQEEFDTNEDLFPLTQHPWASPSTDSMEPSLSSSFSQGNLFANCLRTPSNLSAREDLISTGSSEDILLSPLSIGGPAQVFFGNGMEAAYDDSSTYRPVQDFQMSSVQTMAWAPPPSCDADLQGPMRGELLVYRRPDMDGENVNPRSHPLYELGPREDGLYHCPFAGTEGCKHKADKLKCNYDKHLDSHLKPYRCKDMACATVPFSSTACLLRHEREAHGMHGHGEKPYMCTYPDCDRGQHGNGFPRRWNLRDHMKRVHDHDAIKDEEGQDASDSKGRKKRNSVTRASTKRAKVNTITKATSRSMAAQGQTDHLKKQLEEQYAALQEDMAMTDPQDAQAHQQFNIEIAALDKPGIMLRQLETLP